MYELLLMDEENARLAGVRRIKWLKNKSYYDDIAKLVAYICDTPIALITVVLEDKQVFQGSFGVDIDETLREDSICQYTLPREVNEPLIIEDIIEDGQFSENSLVKSSPKIRFYCGIPFKTKAGINVGAVCAIDTKSRKISGEQVAHLTLISRILTDLMTIK